MAEITVEESRLIEIVDELVRKYIKSSIDDVEEVRRSPAGTILRLEERFEFIQKNMATQAQVMALQADVANLETRVVAIEQNMATQSEVASLRSRIESIEQNMATKADLANLKNELVERIAKLETGQKLVYVFLMTMMAMLVKLVFFP